MSQLVVRPAILPDLSTLRLLWEQLCTEQSTPYPSFDDEARLRWTRDMAMRLERQQSGDPTMATFIAEDEQPLGFLAGRLEERSVGSPRTYWVADHLYVVPGVRGLWHGVGPQLMLAALDHASTLGVSVLECVAVAGDRQWERHGWTPVLVRYAATIDQVRGRLQRPGKAA